MKVKNFILNAFLLFCLVLESQAQTQTTHHIGDRFGGGIVFNVIDRGQRGLISETQDQSTACSWLNASVIIRDSSNHSSAGKVFVDWRLPTKEELRKLYNQKSIIGGFANEFYWSSSEYQNNYAWCQDFTGGGQGSPFKVVSLHVRSIRAF